MGYTVACGCGNAVPVTEGMAGSSVACVCGQSIAVPSLSTLRAQADDGGHFAVPSSQAAVDVLPAPDPHAEVIAPTQADLSVRADGPSARRAPVVIALTSDAVWIQEAWRVRSVPLRDVGVEKLVKARELTLTVPGETSAETWTFAFTGVDDADRWRQELEAQKKQLPPDAPPNGQYQPEGVTLVGDASAVGSRNLGRVECTAYNRWAADRGLQVRAALRGADAVVGVDRQRCRELGWGAYRVSGTAVRVEDADARNRLRLKWYGEEVGGWVRRAVVLLTIQAVLLFIVAAAGVKLSPLEVATGESPAEALASAGWGVGLVFACPLLLVVLLWVLRWPQLLRAAGVAVLAATTGRGVAVWVVHLLAMAVTGASAAEGKLWVMLDPVDWAFVIIGAVLGVRAWRLAAEARQVLPADVHTALTAHTVWARGLLAVSGVYALFILGLVGFARYEASSHLLQAGVDPRREQEGLVALNEGIAALDKGDLAAAERALPRALPVWEQLTARQQVPIAYRANLALTLNNLGWLREQQGRAAEAEQLYARSAALGDAVKGDADFQQITAYARESLARVRGGTTLKAIGDKDRAASRKYEEAMAKAETQPADAERLCREAVAAWEEILPQVSDEGNRKYTLGRLAPGYLRLGELQQQLGQRSAAEAALKKGIDYGEKVLALDPDRPLHKHNLELGRRMLDGLREQALQEEISRLSGAERFAEAIELYRRGIDEQEEQVRSGKDREAAVRRLAYRLDRFAWFLGHCPDGRVRDTRAAVRHARRATELQPDVADNWYTLAMVQYRNGDWRDSLAALETVKARSNGFTAHDWFLSAMNLHHLDRRGEAREALKKGDEWLAERRRQAEDNPGLRIQYEFMRPAVEALRKEAESLLDGKDSTNHGVG